MTKRFFCILIAAVSAAVACTREPLVQEEQPKAPVKQVQAIVPGKAIILFSDELMPAVEADLERGQLVTKPSTCPAYSRIYFPVSYSVLLLPDTLQILQELQYPPSRRNSNNMYG